MTLHVFEALEQGSDQWLAARRGIVTASVVGQLVTARKLTGIDYGCPECHAGANEPCVSKVKKDGEYPAIKTLHGARTSLAAEDDSPPVLEPAHNDYSRSLTAELVAERITGWTDPVYVNNDMMRGTLDEPLARNLYAKHNNVTVAEVGFMVRQFDSGTRLGYSPDGLVGDDGLIEIKSRRPKTQVQTVLAREVPATNMAQIQAGLLVTGRSWCDYISFAGGMALYPIRVEPDPRWFDAIRDAVELFEQTAAAMVADYQHITRDLPIAERIDHRLEVVI